MGSVAKFIYIAICIRKPLGFFFKFKKKQKNMTRKPFRKPLGFFFKFKKRQKNMTLQELVGETVKMYRYGRILLKNKLEFTQMYREMYRELYVIYNICNI